MKMVIRNKWGQYKLSLDMVSSIRGTLQEQGTLIVMTQSGATSVELAEGDQIMVNDTSVVVSYDQGSAVNENMIGTQIPAQAPAQTRSVRKKKRPEVVEEDEIDRRTADD